MAIAAPVNETVNGIVFACFQRYSPSCTTKIEKDADSRPRLRIQLHGDADASVSVNLGSVIKRYFALIQDLCIQHSLGAAYPIRIATRLLPNFDAVAVRDGKDIMVFFYLKPRYKILCKNKLKLGTYNTFFDTTKYQ